MFYLYSQTPNKTTRGLLVQGGSNMTGTNCDLLTHKSFRSYLNHLVFLSDMYIACHEKGRLTKVNILLRRDVM
jgi:hypothetical protein